MRPRMQSVFAGLCIPLAATLSEFSRTREPNSVVGHFFLKIFPGLVNDANERQGNSSSLADTQMC